MCIVCVSVLCVCGLCVCLCACVLVWVGVCVFTETKNFVRPKMLMASMSVFGRVAGCSDCSDADLCDLKLHNFSRTRCLKRQKKCAANFSFLE